ncbi:adenine permease AdeQ [mine drainage metagenome]|uniref:Adenine permease AdeQ n=1 Tax=mine drainage metagenome TaxID=410659 RepID=A0A1J5SEK6_9ZZZZ
MIEKIFQLKQHHTTIKTEIVAGLTTFSTMAYILVVNPLILSKTGMDFNAVVVSTALAAAIGCLMMALYANLPIAQAPGMGLNAFFAYTIVLGMGYSWQFALTAVFLEGILFIALSLLNVREAIINSIPLNLKYAISVGIGFFIALIGLVNAGVIETGMMHIGNNKLDGVIVKLGDMRSHAAILVVVGLLMSAVLLYKKVNAALLIGILIATIVGIPLGLTHLPEGVKLVSMPPSIAPVFFKIDFSKIFSWDMAIILFTLLSVNLFDTVGTLIGCCSAAGLLKDGNVPNVKKALLSDAVATTSAGILGTSVVSCYIESAAGIASGGKTGLTTFTVAIMFLLSLFFAPLFAMIPAAATSSALIIVGLLMMAEVKHINFSNITDSLPAFLAIIMMPFTYSIAEGISFGMISYVLLKLLTGRHKEITVVMYVLAALFITGLLLK